MGITTFAGEFGGIVVFLIVVTVLCIVLIALGVILFVRQGRLNARLNRMMTGADGDDIEASLNDKFRRLEELEKREKDDDADIQGIYDKFENAYQKTGIVKYDAYRENGGKLSFAIAMLDENNNGFVVNVMNSREGSFSYIKEITAGESSIELGDEEAEALSKAAGSLKKNRK